MSYEFTKLSEVEVTSELKEDDVILVVQDGIVKRYTGKVGGASTCCIEIMEDEIIFDDNLPFPMLSHTFYDTISNAVNNNENILFKIPIDGMVEYVNVVLISGVTNEMGSSMGVPAGLILGGFFGFDGDVLNYLYVPSEEFEYVEPEQPE